MLELRTEDMKPEQTADDKERKRSIVIHGLPESTTAKASLKAKEDHESISTRRDRRRANLYLPSTWEHHRFKSTSIAQSRPFYKCPATRSAKECQEAKELRTLQDNMASPHP